MITLSVMTDQNREWLSFGQSFLTRWSSPRIQILWRASRRLPCGPLCAQGHESVALVPLTRIRGSVSHHLGWWIVFVYVCVWQSKNIWCLVSVTPPIGLGSVHSSITPLVYIIHHMNTIRHCCTLVYNHTPQSPKMTPYQSWQAPTSFLQLSHPAF
jgi:hypothetical protein